MRLDIYIAEHHLAESRHRAQELIVRGFVTVNGKIAAKSSLNVHEYDEVQILEDLPYVSRAGDKLAFALHNFNIDPTGLLCLDIGSSTGGFTDCLLQHHAAHVVAVDVGTDQFHISLRNNSKIELFEQTDIRVFSYPQPFDLVVCDVSFISVTQVIAEIERFLKPNGIAILLIKPQFEVTSSERNKQGIVKASVDLKHVFQKIDTSLQSVGLKRVQKILPVSIQGGDGNQEYITAVQLTK